MKNLLFSLSVLFFIEVNGFTQPGSLDTTFDTDGIVITPVGSLGDIGYSIAIQSDGKIVVAGTSDNGTNSDFAVVRYNTDGSLDNTFNTDGKVTTPIQSSGDDGNSVVIQGDGKIVVAGYSNGGSNYDFAVVRYNTDGSLDTTFDTDGKVTTPVGSSFDDAFSVALQSDGKIVVAGYSYTGPYYDFAVVCYNTTGSLDTTFETDGKVTTSVGSFDAAGNSVTIQSDGKIVVAGYGNNGADKDFAVVRYNTDGSLDTTFDIDGKVTTSVGSSLDYCYSVAIQSDGKIIAAGESYNGVYLDFAVVRYNTDGSLDSTFDTDGKVITPFESSEGALGRSVAITNDDKIVVAGFFQNGTNNVDFAVVSYNTDGSLDTTFDTDGKVTASFGGTFDYGYSVAIQNDSKIVVIGSSNTFGDADFAVVRFNGVCTPISSSQNPNICQGDSVTVGSNTYTTGGTYTDTLPAFNGCDSIVTTNLTILPNSSYSQSLTISQGSSVTVGSNTYTASGTYTDTLVASNGCDSIVITNLTVLSGISTIAEQNIKVSIYPNPLNHSATIEIADSRWTQGDLLIYDVLGQTVHQQTLTSKPVTLSLQLPGGIYFYQLKMEEETVAKGKLMVQ